MRLEPTPRPEQVVRVSARLITSSTILHLSSDELERAVHQEQTDNPALDVVEQKICLFCGSSLYGQICSNCGHFAASSRLTAEQLASLRNPAEPYWLAEQQTLSDIDNYGFITTDSDDEYDPLAHIPTIDSLQETLYRQLEALVPPADTPIAEQLVGNLNERGYLECSVEEIATLLNVPTERVMYVLSQLQSLEPIGIGARDLRECLMLQLKVLSELQTPHPLAHTLIDRFLPQIGKNQFQDIARKLKVSEQEVRDACAFIRGSLYPYPAYTYMPESGINSGTTYIRPDVIIRKGENGFEIELIEEKRYRFSVSAYYTDPELKAYDQGEYQRYIHQHSDRARFFVDCVHRRWRTLRRVMELVVNYQRDFFEKGIRYLRPLTRAEVATRLSLDEGTVSRATANKYALLPNGKLMPLSDFFDVSLGIKDVLRELIEAEDPRKRFSDEELARLMTARGIPMARRTVTKYREEMGIGSSRERS
ncbi:RNA polymerase RpoN-/SigL-like sigma 54 subunit [Thermosporothrix hazakensis]|jgi:RNA polymerase sigma-54 factor|uniref:RNA polymerase RpoN-/SigL-like sigma 54 subunit n=2 Tax=Thermosporothrix TaxID=768650 RepID=A0A326UBL2_THEHA|nr:RNA polymerase factor sigma-54 [Thermosporothrix hazakensis]PZW33078.1 RNA polymerase RpoN-/SigL-like sigma 54 subunit [Thermosporothrix hazakensis]BBH91056.1 RNA polymerase sigma-54 factor [Thermosporothrix sp. COM3]GCE49109.1 RNA polymerase sigma-54 factor [Thermosporothrix hazakensis]